MADRQESPRVLDHGWGHVDVSGIGRLRDAKLWPGGGREWDWTETGTRHRPGIQPADVAELLEHDPEVVILSRGRWRRLETCPETLEMLERHGIEFVQATTDEALDAYGDLVRTGRRVAALIHSTC